MTGGSLPVRRRRGTAPRAGLAGWVLFDWAAQPFYTLVLTFLFAPYFANVVIGDGARGQAIWGYATAAGGMIVALGGPLLGAVADRTGRRKPWVFGFSIIFTVGVAALWWAAPAGQANLPLVLGAFVAALAAAEFATVFTNAMMPSLVPAHQLGRLSGAGWAVGYAGGLVSLLAAAAFLVGGADGGRTLLGLPAWLLADGAAHWGERLIGPFCALWYALFIIPFFLFTPEAGRRSSSGQAAESGLGQLMATLRAARARPSIVRFLVARMLYVDGLGAIFAFGGIYAAAVFGWTATALGVFGIVLTVAGGIGAGLGGVLDDRFGARRVIIVSLAGLMVAALGIVSIGGDRVLFVIAAPTATGGPLFGTRAEQLYLLFAVLIGLVAGPLQAAGRSLLARLAPAGEMTAFFGLYAFSGKVTAFAAPLLVGVVTAATGDQRLGIAAILLFLGAGLALMRGVGDPD